MRDVKVKICGIGSVEAARRCEALGADALGLNFWPRSPRCLDPELATEIVGSVTIPCVAVVVDQTLDAILELRKRTGIRWVQLHGGEPPELVQALLPEAYKALGVASASDVSAASRYPGEHLLLDAKVPGDMPGGTGKVFDWDLAARLSRERKLTLAGGLTPQNVDAAIRAVRPWRVDVASGVESAPGVQDLAKVEAFIAAARSS